MKDKPIFPLLMSMALPPMISMLIQSLYNIVDSIFVSRLGEEAITAISLIYPIQNMSIAISCGIGIAANAYIARYLGAGDEKKVSHMASQSMLMCLLHSLIFVVIGLFLMKPFVSLFTDDPLVLKYGIQYGMIVSTFTFGSFIHIEIEKLFQAVGNMMIPMIMQIFGAVVNIVLDPILIFGYFGLPALGVQGAAIATILGQMAACMLSIILFRKYNSQIPMKLTYKIDMKAFRMLYQIAIPSGMMICLPSLLVTLMNMILAAISQTAVAFFGIYYKLQSFIYMPANGVIQGMRPIMSFNYGAKEKERMNQTLKAAFYTIGTILMLGTVLFMTCTNTILNMFHASDTMMNIGRSGLKILSLCFILSAFSITLAGVFESLGKGNHSLILTLTRQFVFVLPLSYLSMRMIGLNGIWFSFVVSEFIACLLALYMYRHTYQNEIIKNL